jgi:hypothetical protein
MSDEWPAKGATRFLFKHGVATAVTVAAVSALIAAVYFALLIWAVLANGGIGSPLTLPIALVFAIVLMPVVALVIFLPVTVTATWIRGRRGFRVLFEIPIAAFLLVIYIFLVAMVVTLSNRGSLDIGSWYAFGVALALLPLLGLYWVCLQSTGWLLTGAERVVAFLRNSRRDGIGDDDRVGPF